MVISEEISQEMGIALEIEWGIVLEWGDAFQLGQFCLFATYVVIQAAMTAHVAKREKVSDMFNALLFKGNVRRWHIMIQASSVKVIARFQFTGQSLQELFRLKFSKKNSNKNYYFRGYKTENYICKQLKQYNLRKG
jgi:hypothetical protein